jgi:hypothetical protein
VVFFPGIEYGGEAEDLAFARRWARAQADIVHKILLYFTTKALYSFEFNVCS